MKGTRSIKVVKVDGVSSWCENIEGRELAQVALNHSRYLPRHHPPVRTPKYPYTPSASRIRINTRIYTALYIKNTVYRSAPYIRGAPAKRRIYGISAGNSISMMSTGQCPIDRLHHDSTSCEIRV